MHAARVMLIAATPFAFKHATQPPRPPLLLQSFTGDALTARVAAKALTIDDATISGSLGSISTQPADAAEPYNKTGVIAGTIVGFTVASIAVAGALVWLHKRKVAKQVRAAGSL